MRLAFDIEANGFLREVSRIHCLVIENIDTGEVHKFEPFQVEQGVKMLMEADQIIGHNIITYDLPVIKKLYPWFDIAQAKVLDTLVLSRLFYPNLSDLDRESWPRNAGVQPPAIAKLYGSHSLKAWGQRIAFHKDDYEGGWEVFSQEMLDYCVRDVAVTVRLHKMFSDNFPLDKFERCIELEHQVAFICQRQVQAGFEFDLDGAMRLNAVLMARRAEIEGEMQDTFKPWYRPVEVVTPKRTQRRKGVTYTAGEPYTKVELVEFNPGSRKQIADRLIQLRGWKPSAYTPDGSVKIDETILSALPYPEAQLLAEYFLVQKRIGMITEGDNGWINFVFDGRIYGDIITNGAVTGRATHRNPNMAQVPSVGAPYGSDCRSLFTVKRGKKLVGIDVSGLELRMLAHFMARYDNGAYGEIVVNGDVHTTNQLAAGLPTRANAKTFIYAFLYGAGDEKIGKIVGKDKKEGKRLKAKFLEGLPALKSLIDAVKKAANQRGCLIGLDGRLLHVRSDHAALNTLLQSAGALICKRWLVEVDMEIERRGWRNKAQQVVWVHDEIQCEVDADIAEEFGVMAVECIVRAQEFFGIRVPLTGEFKIGNNWAETH